MSGLKEEHIETVNSVREKECVETASGLKEHTETANGLTEKDDCVEKAALNLTQGYWDDAMVLLA